MTTLMQASREWASRPADQRFVSLTELRDRVQLERDQSRASIVSSRRVNVRPVPGDDQHRGLVLDVDDRKAVASHWAFGQLAQLAGAPAGYMRNLPAELASDCLNYGLRFNRSAEDIGTLLTVDSFEDQRAPVLRAATGPKYGRIWNADIANALVHRFGDGLTGDFRVPGEFGQEVEVTKANTTLYASDRDMFVFLADERNRVEVPNRRDGQSGSLARGFFVWNSEVGSSTCGIAMFLFDYVCCNRIVWGAEGFREIKLRHTKAAPDRWLEEVVPVLEDYRESSALPIEERIKAAQQAKIDKDLSDFLASRFTKSEAAGIIAAHEAEEGRPIETLWDAATGVTAYAKSVAYQDERVTLERKAGAFLDMAA